MKRLLTLTLALTLILTTVIIPAGQVTATVSTHSKPLARQLANEGIVLLKNDNALPFADGAKGATGERIAIFGEGQIFPGFYTESLPGQPIVERGFQVSGSSSTGSLPERVYSPYEGLSALEASGRISVYDDLSLKYQEAVTNSTSYIPDDAMYENVCENADTAVVIFTRFPNAQRDNEPAEWYLSNEEKTMLQKLTQLKSAGKLEKIVVLLNIECTLDTKWAKDGNADGIDVDAVLSVYFPGEQGGLAIADTLIGDSNPSGKLPDTFANNIEDYPISLSPTSFKEIYKEDIYVGYRYFETFGIDVSYPFGYGLSYTNFEFLNQTYKVEDNNIVVSVDVKNIGTVAGKEVVQAYFSSPQVGITDAKLSKSSIELAAFKKTDIIQPGQTETVTLTFSINDMASYDDEGLTGNKSCYVLEAGNYDIYVGNSIKEAQTRKVGTYNVPSLTVTERLNRYIAPQEAFDKIVPKYESGKLIPATQAVIAGDEIGPVEIPEYTPYNGAPSEEIISFNEVLTGSVSYEKFVSQMTVDELASISVGQRATEKAFGAKGAVGGSTEVASKYDIPVADTFNGSCGLIVGTKGTSFGTEVLMGATWNTDLLYEVGKAMATECLLSGCDIFLADAVEIHRHPLDGGAIVYFSEDPVLAGNLSGNEMLGIHDMGVTNTLKMLGLYNKRYPKSSSSVITERAAREVYFKSYEIAVEMCAGRGKPMSLMSSYNQINGTYTTERSDLMIGLLRNEWGFDGAVISDWGNAADTSTLLQSGGNIHMPSGNSYDEQRQGYVDDIVSAIETGDLTRNELEANVVSVLKFLSKLPDAWVDIAPTSRIYVSSSYASNSDKPRTVNNLFDGSGETDWAAREDNASNVKARMIIDLGKEIPVKMVEIGYARMSSFRKPFSLYLANKGDMSDKTLLFTSDGGNQGGKVKLLLSEFLSSENDKPYRYVIFESNQVAINAGLSSISIYANANDVGKIEDNSILNISDMTANSNVYGSAGFASVTPDRMVDMHNGTVFNTSQGGYQKEQYVFIDLGTPTKVDSITAILSSGPGKNSAATDNDLRTDFDIVGRNDTNFTDSTGDTVLVDYTDTLAKDNGTSSDLCVFPVPDSYKNTEFRYIGLRKKPSSLNNNVGQLGIASFGVYAKAANAPFRIDKPTATYDKEAGTVSVSTTIRTLEDKNYKIIVAGYNDDGTLVEIKDIDLKKASESTRAEKETEVQGLGYATRITKTVSLDNHLDVAYANVILLNDYDSIMPLTKSTQLELNPEYKAQLLKDPVLNYMKAEFDTALVMNYSGSANPKTHYDDQNPVTVEWAAADGATEYTFTISTNPDYSYGKVYTADTNSVTVTNLFVAEKYYWKAVADTGAEATGSFKTQEYAPRFITTETASNLRDLGGWMTKSGDRVKQGLMFRGAEITDDDNKNSYIRGGLSQISDNDLDLMANELGIKTEIDLRGSENGTRTTSILGNNVAYYDKSLGSNDSVASTDYSTLKDIFAIMADDANYPIFFHCVGGNDRTARVAVLVNGLLGVPKDDLIRDWELSSFSFNTVRRRNDSSYWASFNSFINHLETYEGNTLSEKIEDLMINHIGLTKTQVDNIKKIMLGK